MSYSPVWIGPENVFQRDYQDDRQMPANPTAVKSRHSGVANPLQECDVTLAVLGTWGNSRPGRGNGTRYLKWTAAAIVLVLTSWFVAAVVVQRFA